MTSLISRVFRRKPQGGVVAPLPPPPPDFLSDLTATAISTEEAPGSSEALPCEFVFNPVTPASTDLFRRLKEISGTSFKRIPMRSLAALRDGYDALPVPVFDLLDPFYVHAQSPAATASSMLQHMLGSHVSAILYWNRFISGAGVLIQECGGEFVMQSSLGKITQSNNRESTRKWTAASGRHMVAQYCTIPGYIKPEDRQKIRDAKELADKVDGVCRLIVEANWQVAEHVVAKARDPLIVIVKGEDIAYIDRFDCTHTEEYLYREHAVKDS